MIIFLIICSTAFTSPGCSIITVILKNDALAELGTEWQGTYQLSDPIKGHWISASNQKAIWYLPDGNGWLIGNLNKLGENDGYIFAENKTGALHANGNEWIYDPDDDGMDWITANANDINVECSGKMFCRKTM